VIASVSLHSDPDRWCEQMVDKAKNEWTMNDANAFAPTAIRRFCLINFAVTFLDRNPASRRVFLFVADVRYWPKADIAKLQFIVLYMPLNQPIQYCGSAGFLYQRSLL
jgi:hypothetical protein